MYWLLLWGKRSLAIHHLGSRRLPARGPVTRRPRFLTGSFHAQLHSETRDRAWRIVAEILGPSPGSICHHFCPRAAGPTEPQKVNVTRQGPQEETPGMNQQQPTGPTSPPGPGPDCAVTRNLDQPSASFSSKTPSINKMHYIHTTESDSAVNKDEALTHPTRRMNLENRVLNERSQTPKVVYYVITFI